MPLASFVAAVAILAVVSFGISRTKRFRSRLRSLEVNDNHYVRFHPNPGFTFGSFHWCRHYGRGRH